MKAFLVTMGVIYVFFVGVIFGAEPTMALDTAQGMIRTIVPECANEDSTGFCHWNGQTSGNGQGASFLVIGDITINW